MTAVRTGVFTVGGLGTRFLPATKALPKEMLPVVDKPLIQYAVEEARDAGIEQFVFVTGRGKNAIEDHFDAHPHLETVLADRGRPDIAATLRAELPAPGQLAYVRQNEPLGLGHAVWCARHLVGEEPFAVFLPDELLRSENGPCIGELIDVHAREGGNVVSVIDVPREHTNRYGIIDPGPADGRVIEVGGVVEKPSVVDATSTYAIVGRYVLEPTIFDHLDQAREGAGGEIQLTDAIQQAMATTPLRAVHFDGRRYDCGTKLGYLEANIALALQRGDLGGDVAAMVRRVLDELAMGQ